MHLTYVVKKNGEREDFQPEKINQWGEWACSGTTANWSLLITHAIKKMYEGATTSELQRALIDSAVDLIDEDVDYDRVAAKLQLADTRKRAYDNYKPPGLKLFYYHMVEKGLWEDMDYTEEQLEYLDARLDHDRDELFSYAGLKQMCDKYLIQTRDRLYETPQFLYMGMSMAIFRKEPIEDVVKLYNIFSLHKVNVPTPVLVGLRTADKGLASCCVIKSGDSLESINAAINVAYTMTANRAGIGIEMGIRSEDDPVRGGAFHHLGKLPYYKLIDKTVKANTQQSRGGSATVQFCIFDPEIESLLRLKSQRVSDERRIDKLDYSMAVNDFFIQRFIDDKQISLFSIYDAPDLYELFFSKDINEFIRIYDLYEKDVTIPRKTIGAREVFSVFFKERIDTGRMYAFRADIINARSTFKDMIYSSNLCQEIVSPTSEFTDVSELYQVDGDGEVALCNLAAIACTRVSVGEYEEVAYLLLKMVDNIIDYQSYPYPAIRTTATNRRNVGIGLINIAYGLASNGYSYESQEGRDYVHRETEKFSFYLHKASVRLAKEKGPCPWFDRTTYSDGTLPIDNYPKFLDTVCSEELFLPWESLRKDIVKYGMRNSVLEAQMPSETSSVVIGSTNSNDPVRQLITHKSSSTGTVPFIVPDYKELALEYEPAFKVNNQRYAEIVAIMQKFIGQSISYNEYYDYNEYANGVIPIKEVVKNWIYACKLGIKTFYYFNTDVNNGGAANQGCSSGGCTL